MLARWSARHELHNTRWRRRRSSFRRPDLVSRSQRLRLFRRGGWARCRCGRRARGIPIKSGLVASLACNRPRPRNATQPTEIVPNHAWDVGDLWITRQRKVPVLFSRRLYSDVQLEALQIALSRRRGRAGGLVLTSSQILAEFDRGPNLPGRANLQRFDERCRQFAVDRDLVMSPYISPTRVRGVAESIYLSPDGRRLVINGDTTIDFKSDRHVKIIRRLVDGYHEGKRFRASELLGGATVMTLRVPSGPEMGTSCAYLKSKNETWSFDLD